MSNLKKFEEASFDQDVLGSESAVLVDRRLLRQPVTARRAALVDAEQRRRVGLRVAEEDVVVGVGVERATPLGERARGRELQRDGRPLDAAVAGAVV